MAGSARPDAIRAQEAVRKAMNGQLVKLRSYSLVNNGRSFRIGVPPEIPQNLNVELGEETEVFVDFEAGVAVYDFGDSVGGDHDGGEC